MKFGEALVEMISEGSKVSSKRVIALFFSLLLGVIIFVYPEHQNLIDSLMLFIAGLIGFTVANKHKAFQKDEKLPSGAN